MPNTEDILRTYVLDCPECTWSTTFDPKKAMEREKEKIDAGLHYVEEHGGKIPGRVNFGNHQCPKCYDILGLNGTVSCSECGWIKPEARA